jgi:hypothetical protein
VRIGRQTCALRPVGRIQLSVWRCWLDHDTCGPATYPVFVRCPRGLESDRGPMTMSLSRTGSLSCWTAMATKLLWPTMAKLRSGSFRIGVIEIRKPARHKRQCCPTVAEGNDDLLRGFPCFNDGRRCQSGRHCPALRCLFAEAVLLRGTHAGHRRRLLQQRREYSPSRLDQLLSTEAHTTHSRRFNDKPLPGHGAKRAAAFSVNATFECLAESAGDRLNMAEPSPTQTTIDC